MCGFDSSLDFERHPTLGPVGRGRSTAALRREWMEQHKADPPAAPARMEPELPTAGAAQKRKRAIPPLLIAAAFLVTLGLGIWIGSGFGADNGASQKNAESNAMRQFDPPGEVIYGEIGTIDTKADSADASVFGSDYKRGEILSVTFLDTLSDAPMDAWDISQGQDATVLAWVVPNSGMYDLYIGGEGGVWAPESCAGLFKGYENAASITFSDAFHTENVRDMSSMFEECRSLTDLDLRFFDTSRVENMVYMFSMCDSLVTITRGDFDTSAVRNMCGMFFCCSSLTKLNLSKLDTSCVEDMALMFYGCSSLQSLNLSYFDTRRVDSMRYMFSDCIKLTDLELGGNFVINCEDTQEMFKNCPAGDQWDYLIR